ncbi:hypothetical protein [Aliikangiella maris]|uniref:Scaffold protein FimL second domain-containing protein n=2 Tax=Aliikangiella maris TaxID=3162458 RepID=A0ABV2BUX2_9GAMM
MSQTSALQSLDLILEDVSAEINLSINALEQFSRARDNLQPIKKSLTHLKKLKGVFYILEMKGAEQLVKDAGVLVKSLPKKQTDTQSKLLEVVSTALARLMRYTEHVNQKPYDLPQLLLPAINNMRSCVNAPQLVESVFFTCEPNKPRADRNLVLITSEESAEKSRYYRKMYQAGLIEVLRQTNLIGGLKMMQRAIHKLDSECPRPNSPNLWWIAGAMLDGIIEGTLVLTKNRLKLFSKLDQQIRLVENKPVNINAHKKSEATILAKEMLYLTMIGGASSKRVEKLLTHFNLQHATISDTLLRKETREMRGPSDQDYNSISEALLDEIKSITEAIKISQENEFEPLDLSQTQKQLINLSNLLSILQVEDQRVRLNVVIELVDKAITQHQKIGDKDIKILLMVLQNISKVVNESDLAKYSGKASIRRGRISKMQQEICENTSKNIHQLIKQFEEFNNKNRKVLLLKDIQVLLKTIRESFSQLKVDDAVNIIDGCLVFIVHHLTRNPHTTTANAINHFADIISSLDFYLETLLYTATPSPKILELAQNSLLHLNRESKQA